MTSLKKIIQYIINEGTKLRDKYIPGVPMRIDYICIFSQIKQEFDFYNKEALKLGKVADKTPTGSVYMIDENKIDEYNTRLVKVRIPDKTRPQRGDVDFTINNYEKYKPELMKFSVNLIEREGYEMIELVDPKFNCILYFSNPPLSKVLNLN